jgi:hypothetical protein
VRSWKEDGLGSGSDAKLARSSLGLNADNIVLSCKC